MIISALAHFVGKDCVGFMHFWWMVFEAGGLLKFIDISARSRLFSRDMIS
jgi:hypothetical protein